MWTYIIQICRSDNDWGEKRKLKQKKYVSLVNSFHVFVIVKCFPSIAYTGFYSFISMLLILMLSVCVLVIMLTSDSSERVM